MSSSNTSAAFTKIADRVYIATARVTFDTYRGEKRTIKVELRIDGREGNHYRVDCAKGIALWEAIDGSGRQPFPTTLVQAKEVAKRWLSAANAQGTLSPA